MVSGFLGTVIGMERAVASKYKWTYLTPLLCAIGAILIIFDMSVLSAQYLILVASILLFLHFLIVLKQFPLLHIGIMSTGALLWVIGNLFWLNDSMISNVVIWWAGFLVLTIAGERLELSRILQPSRPKKVFFTIYISLFIMGAVYSSFNYATGIRICGIAVFFLAVWLFQNDLAWKSRKQEGLPKFVALALIFGFMWLPVAGILAVIYGNMNAGPFYDAIWHAIFLGFVFSMIFGHAPIIFPAVLKIKMTFSYRYYIHLYLLHFSLVIRIFSDIAGWIDGRLWGSIFNGIAILLFILNTVASIRKE